MVLGMGCPAGDGEGLTLVLTRHFEGFFRFVFLKNSGCVKKEREAGFRGLDVRYECRRTLVA